MCSRMTTRLKCISKMIRRERAYSGCRIKTEARTRTKDVPTHNVRDARRGVSKPKARKKLADFSRPVQATAVILAIASMSRRRASRTDLGTAESNLQPLD
jgi:hypothetical protein